MLISIKKITLCLVYNSCTFIFLSVQPPPRRARQLVAVADPPVMSATDYHEDGSCIICYEDMIDFNSSRLNCGHRFHTEVND